MEAFVSQSPDPSKTTDFSSVLSSRVLSKNGTVLGKVSRLHFDPGNDRISGIVFRYGLKRREWYVCRPYIDRIGSDAVLLSIDPVLMHEGKKVISADGKTVGKLVQVVRKDSSNKIDELVLRRRLYKTFTISPSEVNHFGDSLILKQTYDQAKKFFKS